MKFSISLNNSVSQDWGRVVAALLLLLALFGPLTASAVRAQTTQQSVTFESVQVEIWPEYDQPSALVMYHVALAPTVTLPATLSMRIPAAAGKPYAVAMQDVNGLYDLKYSLIAAGEWIQVNFTTPVPDFRVEYYDPSLNKNNGQRNLSFTWPADYTTNNLSIKVQQPIAATNVSFSPSIGAGVQGDDGLTYFTKLVGSVPEGMVVELKMRYDNPQNTLTNPKQFSDAQPSQPVDASTPGRVTLLQGFSMSVMQVVMLVAGILLFFGGLAWYLQTGGRRWLPAGARAQTRHRHARSTAPQTVEAEGAPENVFCHHCGKRASVGDTFCRACGTKLRW